MSYYILSPAAPSRDNGHHDAQVEEMVVRTLEESASG
jgi:hypothetical protein